MEASDGMGDGLVQRHRTALHRVDVSRPIRLGLESGIISPGTSVFDYGCGRGEDLRRLEALGVRCSGWDPAFRTESPLLPADVVNLGYVVNVIEDAAERAEALRRAWSLAQRVLIVSARLTTELSASAHTPWADGFVTRRSTFQKFFEQQELREWIDSVLRVSSVPAAPGVFVVFRHRQDAETYLATRIRRRAYVPRVRNADRAFETHRDILTPLMDFVATRGRLPIAAELGEATSALTNHFRSIRAAFDTIRQATGPAQWDAISKERADDLLVYLALSCFTRRPSQGELPDALRLDIRALLSTYRAACEAADKLLFAAGRPEEVSRACAASTIGKCTPEALYLHIDALTTASSLIRVYEGCARAYVGSVDGANVVKMHRQKPQVSYLSYPGFDDDPHPPLRESLKVRFRGLKIEYRDYRDSANPFILHRKETFIRPDHPLYSKFRRLTAQEEVKGLLGLNANQIGTRSGWQRVLETSGHELRGHRLVRTKRQVADSAAPPMPPA